MMKRLGFLVVFLVVVGAASSQHKRAVVTVETKENGLLVKVGGKPFFFYHTKEAMPPADSPAYYRRSGFIHPMYSPSGAMLTDDFPAGHAHQHGLFMTWVNNRYLGEKVDFWNQHKQTGTVAHAEVISIEHDRTFVRIKTRLRHISLKHGPILDEIWTMLVYPSTSVFMMDLESDQMNITKDTLFLDKYNYGGLAFRGSRKWNSHDKTHFKNNWHILTSEGKTDSSANHTHARWVDASGSIKGKMNGVTIMAHSSNFRYPQAIRVHPDMPYWCFAPVVDGDFYIAPGQSYKSKFRIIAHTGGPQGAVIEELSKDW